MELFHALQNSMDVSLKSLVLVLLVSIYPIYDLTKKISQKLSLSSSSKMERAFILACTIWLVPWILLGIFFVLEVGEITILAWVLAVLLWVVLWYRWNQAL